jgi:hypothetical protein
MSQQTMSNGSVYDSSFEKNVQSDSRTAFASLQRLQEIVSQAGGFG